MSSPNTSYPTKPAFQVYAKGWDANLLKHPMMQFMRAHNLLFDTKQYPACVPYYSPTMTYVKSSGEIFSGRDSAVNALNKSYTLFSEYFHEPVYGTIVDHEDGQGHRLFGTAKMFVNLAGPIPLPEAERRHEDLSGKKWECVTQGGFIFDARKTTDEERTGGLPEYRLEYFQIMADPVPILKEAVRRGVIPVEAILV